MKNIVLAVFLLLVPAVSLADEPLTIEELRACIERDYLIQADTVKLEASAKEASDKREMLRNLEAEAQALKERMEQLRKSGDTTTYNDLVVKHNELVDKHDKLYAEYDRLIAAYNKGLEELDSRKALFSTECVERRFYRLDLLDACDDSPYGTTRYCEENRKKKD